MKPEKTHSDLTKSLEILSLNFQDLRARKKYYQQFLKLVQMNCSKHHLYYDIKKSLGLIYSSTLRKKYTDLTVPHVELLEELVTEIFTSRRSFLLHTIDEKIYNDPQNRFANNQGYKSSIHSLHTVRKDLKCMKCGHIGAIHSFGQYNTRTQEMSHSIGFGGTIPYQCTNCNNVGLDVFPLEGYEVTFEQIDSPE